MENVRILYKDAFAVIGKAAISPAAKPPRNPRRLSPVLSCFV